MFTYTTKTILAILLPISLLCSYNNTNCTTREEKKISLPNIAGSTEKGLKITGSVAKIFIGTLLAWFGATPTYYAYKSDQGGPTNTIKRLFQGFKVCPFRANSNNNIYLQTLAPLTGGIILVGQGTKELLKHANICTDCAE